MSLFHVCFQLVLLKATLCAECLASALHGTLAKDNILECAEMPNKGIFLGIHICFILLSFELSVDGLIDHFPLITQMQFPAHAVHCHMDYMLRLELIEITQLKCVVFVIPP